MSRIPDDDIIEEEEEEDVPHCSIQNEYNPIWNEYAGKIDCKYSEDDLIVIFLELRDYAERNALPIFNAHLAGVSFVEWVKQ